MINSSNSRIPIADLLEKSGIEDTNLMIVEDAEDTKKSTVSELKKAFSGDGFDPTDSKFYTSKKVQQFIQDLKRDINTRANEKDLDKLRETLNNIVAGSGNGNKDTELIAARNGKATLSDRLQFDNDLANSKYMEKIKKSITGKTIYLEDHYGYIDLSIVEALRKETTRYPETLTIHSRNLLDWNCIIETLQVVKSEPNKGATYTQGGSGYSIEIPLPIIYPSGEYTFLSSISFSDDFRDNHVQFSVRYSDGTVDTMPYSHEESFSFETRKGFDKLIITYDPDNYVRGSKVTFRNMMLVNAPYLPTTYIPYERIVRNMAIGDNIFEFYNNNYIYECAIQNGELSISYYDNTISTQYLYDKLLELRDILDNKIDKCGMITDYGVYQFLDDMYIHSYGEGIRIEDSEEEYDRNGVHSKKITIAEDTTRNTIFRIPVNNPVEIIETIGIFFYMDRPDYWLFDDKTGGLKLRLCSDNIAESTETNYYEYLIGKKEMVQGWNFVKKRITDFASYGNPDPNAIKFMSLEICRNDEMRRKTLYINSFVFNQKMKPTVILCLNGTYDESVSYLYPYLKTRGIKPTIFLNQKKTLSYETVDNLMMYRIVHGWDIGLDSCHPNKEILIQDDNYRNQFVAINSSHEWLRSTLVATPISYSASYGNLRPITASIIKELGYKIAKTDSNGYCGFFSDKELCVPMHLISNEVEADDVIDLIDHAIESSQTVILYANDVTEYGSEIDAKKVTLESVIKYIQERVAEGSVECMTLKDFYNKCIN